MRGIHRWPVNSYHKGPVTRKLFPFDDVIMWSGNRKNEEIPSRHVSDRVVCLEDLQSAWKYQNTHSCLRIVTTFNSNHCGMVTPYGGIDLGQHWRRHPTVNWTNVEIISRFWWHSPKGDFTGNAQDIYSYQYELKIHIHIHMYHNYSHNPQSHSTCASFTLKQLHL